MRQAMKKRGTSNNRSANKQTMTFLVKGTHSMHYNIILCIVNMYIYSK